MLNVGLETISNIYQDSSEIASIYLGTEELYSSVPFVFTGLDTSGNVTTDTSQIVAYMIGDNSTVQSNGLKKLSDATKLKSIKIPNTYKNKPVIKVGQYALSNITSATSIQFGSNVTHLAQQSFQNCSGLTSITIPDAITQIDAGAFIGCSNATSITIGSGITIISNSLFARCSSLKSITIPSTITSIGAGAFSDCSSLTSIIISENVTWIGGSAFENCTKVISINFNAINCADAVGNQYVFENCGSEASGIELWIGANVTRLPGRMFTGSLLGGGKSSAPNIDFIGYDDYYTTVLKTFGVECFRNVTSLKGLYIPASVNKIEQYCIFNSGITDVNFENKTNWKAGTTSISSSQLSNTTTAATLLRETYSFEEWTRT